MSLYDRWFPLPEVPAVPVIIANNVVVPPVPLDVNVASIVPISGVVYQGSNPWLISGPVTGPLTNTELRLTPVNVNAIQSGTWNITNISGTISLPTGASTLVAQNTGNASLSSIDSKLTSPLTVTGPLTDTQLRASPVPISGTIAATQSGTWTTGRTWSLLNTTDSVNAVQSGTWTTARSWTLSSSTDSVNIGNFPATVAVTQSTSPWIISGAVTGPLTDTQLRATPVPISGTVTANAGTNLNTSLLALDSTVAKDASLTTLNTSVNTLLKPASTLAAVTTVSTVTAVTAITNALPTGTNALGTVGVTTTSTSSVTSVNGNAGNVQLLASTAGRRQATFYNESTGTLYLKLGTTSSITSYTVQVPPSGYYELPLPCYTGEIDGIWSIANGAVRITELT